MLVAASASAQEVDPDGNPTTDAEGTKDHPAVKRYPGSVITDGSEREFESFQFPLSDDAENGNTKNKVVEGKWTKLEYHFPKKASCTQIIRNYENAFKAGGLTLHQGKLAPAESTGWGEARWLSGEGKGKGGGLFLLQTCDMSSNSGVLWVVEQQKMEQKVEIDASAMAEEIEKSGHIALYGSTSRPARPRSPPTRRRCWSRSPRC